MPKHRWRPQQDFKLLEKDKKNTKTKREVQDIAMLKFVILQMHLDSYDSQTSCLK